MQLYKAHVARTLKESGAIEHTEWILMADSAEGARHVMSHHLDDEQVVRFLCGKVDRCKPNIYRVGRRIEMPQSMVREDRTNQPRDRSVFAVGVAGKLWANDDRHALRRLGMYLLSNGEGIDGKSPLHDGGIIQVEEIGESDSTAISTMLPRMLGVSDLTDARMVRVRSV